MEDKGCLVKAIIIILAIAFLPITITIFVIKSDLSGKAKLIIISVLWLVFIIIAYFAPSSDKNQSIDRQSSSATIQENSVSSKNDNSQTDSSHNEQKTTTVSTTEHTTTTPQQTTTTTTTTTTQQTTTTTTTTTQQTTTTTTQVRNDSHSYVANTNTKKFHYDYCASVEDIKAENRWDYYGIRDELISQGYSPCKRCNP